MYVCELDRPWLETPFLFQGFELKTPEDIEAVRQHCQYVYIDILRTRTEEVNIHAPTPRPFHSAQKISPFGRELQAAAAAVNQTSNLVRTFLDDIRFGTSIDIEMAREAVAACVASVMRNADAVLFMTQMRDKSALLSQHALNTSVYAIIVGWLAGLDAKQMEELGTSALLHDVGMVSIADKILNKPGKLSDEEFALVKRHTLIGRDILMSGRNLFSGTVDVAYGHHENLDGSGYPRGLTEAQLNLNCRIVAVVDKYDALVSPRPYRPAYTHLDALNILNTLAKQKQLDAKVVNGLIAHLGIYPPGSIVELSTGEKAIVLETNQAQRLRPRILVVRDPDNNPVARFVDMAIKQTDEQGQLYKIRSIHRPGAFGINLLDYRSVIAKSLS
jgi:HD-GYP domain-containing protein (c-di-GMP phosphodiesterase class II)